MLHNMLHRSMFALFGLVVNKGSTLAAKRFSACNNFGMAFNEAYETLSCQN